MEYGGFRESVRDTELEMGSFIITENDERMVREIEEMVNRWEISLSFECCIYRVPENIRCVKEAAYTPHMVSIGPYHYGNRRFMSMEGFKRSFCNALIGRSSKTFNDVVKRLAMQEGQARSYYEETIELSSREFLGMILIDGCFIIEYLLRLHYPEFKQRIDDLPSMQLLKNHIKRDMVLLENQLPYFILELLFHEIDPLSLLRVEERPHPRSLGDLVMSFFEDYNKHSAVPDFSSVKHFTDLIRTLHKPAIPNRDYKYYNDFEFAASATQLYETGVKFTPVPGKCLLEIDFKNQNLQLPCFELNDEKESLYRNLLALEVRHYPKDTFITDYFAFMDTLINSASDVSLLVESGVLSNRFGDYWDASNVFNSFCAGITHQSAKSYLRPICEGLNAYYKKPSNAWLTSFKRNYFGTPIKAAASIIAFSVTLLTFISTVCSVISVT